MKRFRNLIPVVLSSLVLLFLSGFNSFAQIEENQKEYPREKIYLHFDRPFYVPGETIWYKAYLLNANSHAPSTISGIIYVELLGHSGEVIVRQILKAENGFANGEFLLPGSLAQGKFQVRAYTHWMRNFNQDFFFTREIMIYDPHIVQDSVKMDASFQAIDLQFFPEGGSLVSGLTSKVAFKAIDETGKGICVKGEITDQDGFIVVPFESFHLGMGAFELKPEKGKTYLANLISENGKKIKYEFPAVSETGLVMTVDNSLSDVLRVIVKAKGLLANDLGGGLVLELQSGAQIYHTSQANLNRDLSLSVEIPKKSLPTGINQITLFDSEGEPQSERLIFVNHHDALSVKIKTNKLSYAPREKVQLSISVSDVHGDPVRGHFSLAVTDLGQLVYPGKYENNILSNLLLTSELKGNIEKPGFYFNQENPDAETALDYLMLSQGWRRYLWRDMLDNQQASINYTAEKEYFERKGRLLENSSVAPGAMSRSLFLMPMENGAYSRFPDENGIFQMNVHATYEKAYLFYDVDDTKGQRSGCKIAIQDMWPELQSKELKEAVYLGPEIKNCLERRAFRSKIESSYGLSSVIYNTNKSDKINFLFGEADEAIRLDQYNSFTSMVEVIREVVPYVSYVYNKEEDKIRVYSSEQVKRFDHQPLFFVDGIPTYSKAFILNLEPELIESIGVINSSTKLRQFGFLGINGGVVFQTKNGTTTTADINDPHILEYQGCKHPREFYSPVYENSPETDRSKPDLRTLLYWNPKVLTDSNGKASVSFYNTDNITRIGLQFEGISYEGTPGFAGYKYKIIPEKIQP